MRRRPMSRPRVRELTAGKGADIVFNTVGDPYFRPRTNRWRCAAGKS